MNRTHSLALPSRNFRALFALLGCLILSLAWPRFTHAAEVAGQLVAATGQVTAIDAKGSERRLRRRSEVQISDTVRVGANGFAQIRFSDQALISLRADSELKIADYRFNGDPASDRAALELVKGGLRTITGAIGRSNRDNYSVSTPVATVGIRGTHYGLRMCLDDCPQDTDNGLYGGVLDGAVGVTNNAGEAVFGNDRYFYVRDMDTLAEELLAPPDVVYDGYRPPLPSITKGTNLDAGTAARDDAENNDDLVRTIAADPPTLLAGSDLEPHRDTTPPTEPPVESTQAANGSRVAFAAVASNTSGEPLFLARTATQDGSQTIIHTEVFNNSGANGPADYKIIDMTFPASDCGGSSCTFDHDQAGIDDLLQFAHIAFGRWSSSWTLTNFEPLGDWHYAIVDPAFLTSTADFDLLASDGRIMQFALVSGTGTTPSDQDGAYGSLLADQTAMTVDFGQRQITSFSVGVNFSDSTRSYLGQLIGKVGFAQARDGFNLSVSCEGCLTPSGDGRANVNFVGTQADFAFGSFELHTQDNQDAAVGTFLLGNQGELTPQDQPAPDGSLAAVSALAVSGGELFGFAETASANPDTLLIYSGSDPANPILNRVSRGGSCGAFCDLDGSANSRAEAATTANQNGATVSWGAWNQPWLLNDSGAEPVDRLFYVYSDSPTTQQQLDGLTLTGFYSFADGPTPVDDRGHPGIYLNGSPLMEVDFSTRTINYFDVGVEFPDTGEVLFGINTQSVPFASAGVAFPLSGGCEGCGGQSFIEGTGNAAVLFSGPGADLAGTAWTLQVPEGSAASGSAVLVRGSGSL